MARAIIPGFAVTEFGNLPDIRDDVTNGWQATFQVVFTGTGAGDGFMRDAFTVHFLDSDLAAAMKNKIRAAARARAVELGVTDGATIQVIAMIPPERL
jgi:hypothetical protein